MRIRLNGEEYALEEEGCTVDALLASLRLDARKVAVEVNLSIVPRSSYTQLRIAEGDGVEIVRFIGGG